MHGQASSKSVVFGNSHIRFNSMQINYLEIQAQNITIIVKIRVGMMLKQ